MINTASSKGYGGWLRNSRVLLASRVTVKKGFVHRFRVYKPWVCRNGRTFEKSVGIEAGPLGLVGSWDVVKLPLRFPTIVPMDAES